MDFGAHSIIWIILVGLIIGAIAKLLMPGKDPGGCIVTILLGIAGALVGTWIGRLFMGENYVAGWIMSIVGALILLLLYRLIFRRGVLRSSLSSSDFAGFRRLRSTGSVRVSATAISDCFSLIAHH